MMMSRFAMTTLLILLTSLSAHSLSCYQTHTRKVGVGHARVAISGSHTDYNLGWTLAALLPVKTTAIVGKQQNGLIEVSSQGKKISYRLGSEQVVGDWGDYIRGITAVLKQDGHSINGAKIEIFSDIPLGAGISSSAALVTAVFKALRQTYDLPIDDLQIAKMGQRVEHFVGAKTGLLDQMTISLLDQDVNSALFIDFSSMQYKKVKMPADAEFVIVHSGLTHSLKDTEGTRNYATRRSECEGVCDRLKISSLSAISLKELEARKNELEPKNYQRAHHVVSENDRVQRFMKSAEAGNLAEMGRIMNESHHSQKNDYDISEAPIDALVEILQNQPAVYGAQLTGGGFGGAVVFLAQKGQGTRIAEAIKSRYLSHPKNGGHYEAKIIAPVSEWDSN
ncbi:MAG: galactokinase [Pseudobdellovibrionaceae bacterium]